MRVTILGSGPSSGVPMIGDIWGDCDPREPRNHRRRSSILIESGDATVLVDSSPDCRAQLLDAGVTRLDAILYTHAHADHSHGIDDLRWINAAMKAPLPAYGDAHTLETLQERFGYCFTPLERFEGRPLHYYKPVLEPNEVTGPFKVAGMAITPFEQQHGRRSKTLGFRIGNFGYPTDVSMLAGMLTFREIIRHVHASGGDIGESTIRGIMDDAPVSVSPNTSADEVQRLMLEKHARYIPVMDGPTLMGVISFYDMAQAIVAAQKFENNMRKAYIRDWPSDSEEPAAS